MELILWRHADAESGIPDAGRRLTDEGRREAARLARWLKPRLPPNFTVLASPARRAQETARALTAAFQLLPAAATGATPQALLEAAGWPERGGAVLVVGHQPTLGQAAALALSGRVIDFDVEKGAIWWLVRHPRTLKTRLRAVIAPDMAFTSADEAE